MDGGIIDLAPFVNEIVIPTLAAIMTGLVGAGVAYLFKRLGLQQDSEARAALERALQSAAALAVQKAAAAAKPFEEIHTDSAALASAANYVIASVPGALKQLDITPDKISGSVIDAIGLKVAARIPEAGANMAVALAAPVTEQQKTAALNLAQGAKP